MTYSLVQGCIKTYDEETGESDFYWPSPEKEDYYPRVFMEVGTPKFEDGRIVISYYCPPSFFPDVIQAYYPR